jgi:hypothetical protein
MAQNPSIGRIVVYRSRTGRYDVPAIITATTGTLDPQGVELFEESNGERGVPPLSSPDHVHLTVFTPGLPGFRAQGLHGAGDTPLAERDQSARGEPRQGYGENTGGSYQEWNVPLDEPMPVHSPVPGVASVTPDPEPGSWRWPERV